MERIRQKGKKEKSTKYVDKDKSSSVFISDVKSIRENLKIKEILRTVKMNSSMRIKAPRGSKVMSHKDFNEDSNDEVSTSAEDIVEDTDQVALAAEHTDDVSNKENDNIESNISENSQDFSEQNYNQNTPNDTSTEKSDEETEESNEIINDIRLSSSYERNIDKITEEPTELPSTLKNGDIVKNGQLSEEIKPVEAFGPQVRNRERKLSLDHTILTRRDGLSQSELDLNSIGKSPLERKSSFFRKKMDSFLRNTTEMFKRQSMTSKSQQVHRRGSMSMSLQSLNDATNDVTIGGSLRTKEEALQSSEVSLNSSSTVDHSVSNVSVNQAGACSAESDVASVSASQPTLFPPRIEGVSSESVQSLNEAHIQDSLLNTRAISMSSGLDTVNAKVRRKTSRSNRVTWLASEGLANYFSRLLQAEKGAEGHVSHSYQDFSSIPENARVSDSRGRRLSYQRAVSGEDPVLAARYQDNSLRRRPRIPEASESSVEVSRLLQTYATQGIPELKGFEIANIPKEAFQQLDWILEDPNNVDDICKLTGLTFDDESRQAVMKELILTEADHIKHLRAVVDVFIATAHALQDAGLILDVDTEKLFLNIPDVYNASLYFWYEAMYPMIADAVERGGMFDPELMQPGFCSFREIFAPYEKYVGDQWDSLDYLRELYSNTDFMLYLTWCHSQKACNRLQLMDLMAKPMQRLTKYGLILRRIIAHADRGPDRTSLLAMVFLSFTRQYVLELNRAIRQKQEIANIEALASSLEGYELDFKDDDMDRFFRMYSNPNLLEPMINCLPQHRRSIIYQSDVRFKDNLKEVEARAILMTDMMIICKKLPKASPHQYKLIRPKYMIDKIATQLKYSRSKELTALIFMVVDDFGSAATCFSISDTSKDPRENQHTLRTWEIKVKEARHTYDLGVWFAKNPSRDITEVEPDSPTTEEQEANSKASKSDEYNIEREARERVAAMLYRHVPSVPSLGNSTEHDYSMLSMHEESFDGRINSFWKGIAYVSGGRGTVTRPPLHRNSTGGSSRNSRLSSFQQSQQSTSGQSHDESLPRPHNLQGYRATRSVELVVPTLKTEEPTVTNTITVNVVSESDSETIVVGRPPTPPPGCTRRAMTPQRSLSPQPSLSDPLPTLADMVRPRPNTNSLRVNPNHAVLALMHSLPDLTLDRGQRQHSSRSLSPQSASEKLYQSHQELLQRNRMKSQHHLTPEHRGSSYPPPSPTRTRKSQSPGRKEDKGG